MTRTALVTGASGYVGGFLAKRLAEAGWAVHAVVRPSSPTGEALGACAARPVYDGSYASLAAALAAARPDAVFHLAAEYHLGATPEAAERLVASNVLFTVQLAEAMLAAGSSRLVHAGTFWQHYGQGAYCPVDLYGATKQAAEDLLLAYREARGLSCVTLTLFDNYGPADPRPKLLNLLIGAALSGEELGVSPGDQLLDLCHVEDVADAFLAAGEYLLRADGPVWEKGFVGGERMTVKALVERVGSALDLPVRARFGARPYHPREIMVPIEPVPSPALAGWSRRRSLVEALPEMMRLYRPPSRRGR